MVRRRSRDPARDGSRSPVMVILAAARAVAALLLIPAATERAVALETPHFDQVWELSEESSFGKYPALTFDRRGVAWAAWTDSRAGRDRILISHLPAVDAEGWSTPWRLDRGEGFESGSALGQDENGRLWALWHGRRGGAWAIHGRMRSAGVWGPERPLSLEGESAHGPVLAAAADRLWTAWEVAAEGRFSLAVRWLRRGRPSEPLLLSSAGSDRRPALAACASGEVYLAWDSTRTGNSDIFLARLRVAESGPELAELRQITGDGAGDDTPSLACGPAGELWIAWNSNRAHKGEALRTDRHSGDAFVRLLREGRLLAPPGMAGTLPGQVSHGLVNKTPRDAVEPYWHWKRTQNYPRVFHDGRGAWIVWRSDVAGAHDFQLLARYHDGTAYSEELNLTPFSPGRDEWPVAALSPAKELLMAWEGQLLPTAERAARFGDDEDAYNANQTLAGRLRRPQARPLPALPEPVAPDLYRPEDVNEPPRPGPARGSVRAGGGRWTIYFGDPHSHSVLSDGKTGWPDQLLGLARDHLELDFAVVSDHAEMGILQPSEWALLQRVAAVYDQPGRFVALNGWEWTAGAQAGHRVALFKRQGAMPLSSDRPPGDSIEELYAYLRGHEVVLSPHHTGHATWGRWHPDAHHDESLEPNFEIASWHGRYEFYGNPHEGRRQVPGHQYQDALRRGRHVGVMAASDTHHTSPGEGGLTAVLAEELSRESLFEALRQRRNYATTGVRIVLEFTAAGAPMGTILEQVQGPLELRVRVEGTAAVDRVEIVRDLVDTFAAVRLEQNPEGPDGVFTLYQPSEPQGNHRLDLPDTRRLAFTVVDEDEPAGETSYYVRVTQADGHQAWSSPIWVRR